MRYKRRSKSRSVWRKLVDYLSTGLLFVTVALAAAFFANLTSEEISGSFKVVDGDTLLANGEKLRLEGIDAPEWLQMCRIKKVDKFTNWPCGKRSTTFLRELISSRNVSCKTYGVDKYARPLVRCFDGVKDINAEMVASGWAVSYGDYYTLQARAKAKKLGIWQGEFEQPREWREIHKGNAGDETMVSSWTKRFKNWLFSLL